MADFTKLKAKDLKNLLDKIQLNNNDLSDKINRISKNINENLLDSYKTSLLDSYKTRL